MNVKIWKYGRCFYIKIHIIDAPCGSGKTSGAINMMNNSDDEKRYLFITPFLKEVTRIKHECTERNFLEPQEMGSKLNGIHWLIDNEKNIVSTHALFLNFNEYTIELLRQKDYTLVLDEVVDIVDVIEISKKDLESILERYAHVEDDLLVWDDLEYSGVFERIMHMALNKCVGVYKDMALVWCFPVEIFNIFTETYILTYMFESQMQKYYYDFYGLKYDYKYIKYDGEYTITDNVQKYILPTEYRRLINICDHDKLNLIGDGRTALSASWYERDNFNRRRLVKILKDNIANYFKHIVKTPSKVNMWTTFKKSKKFVSGGGYARGFVPIGVRATNDYRNKISLAYGVNIFMNPVLKQFFSQRYVEVNDDMFALSEMIQWIWRSAIRDGKPINIYIPSKRMRELLINWLNNESI